MVTMRLFLIILCCASLSLRSCAPVLRPLSATLPYPTLPYPTLPYPALPFLTRTFPPKWPAVAVGRPTLQPRVWYRRR